MNSYRLDFPDIGKEESPLSRGTVHKKNIDAGLSMRVWNLNFAQGINLHKKAEPMHSQFYFLFILTPESITLETVDRHVQYNNYRERHAILIPDNVSVQFRVKAQMPVHIIELNIPVWWLKDLLLGRNSQSSVSQLWGDPDFKTVYTETGSWQINTLAGQLFNQVHEGDAAFSGIKPLAISLISAFIDKTFSLRSPDAPKVKDIYHGKMEEAEQILMQHLKDKLPNLAQIARQLAISESTLKRHFKLLYGKSIYGYYLARKMELARQLMEVNPSSVNEMADMLGYEKVSYFIEIFKKYHGFCPGEIRKRRKSA
jgi:AraC-like DNA-binding protein